METLDGHAHEHEDDLVDSVEGRSNLVQDDRSSLNMGHVVINDIADVLYALGPYYLNGLMDSDKECFFVDFRPRLARVDELLHLDVGAVIDLFVVDCSLLPNSSFESN